MERNCDFWEFVAAHADDDPATLWLRSWDCDRSREIVQIEAYRKAYPKIPSLINAASHFVFPNTVVAEQCTSEVIARWHASLFEGCDTVADLTAGLCVDAYYISQRADKLIAIEINSATANASADNMANLKAKVDVINDDAVEWLSCNPEIKIDAIFIDPARRDADNDRVYALEQCSPNIFDIIPLIERRCRFMIVKASPMLDISYIAERFPSVTDIWIVGIAGECKELLFKISFEEASAVNYAIVHTLNFLNDWGCQRFYYPLDHLPDYEINYALPMEGMYLYVPNSCVAKTGAWRQLAAQYPQLSKLHPNTHLFVSVELLQDFPGRIFKITDVMTLKQAAKSSKAIGKANVAVRNFPLTAAQLKAKLKLDDGGAIYLFGCTAANGSRCVIKCMRASMLEHSVD